MTLFGVGGAPLQKRPFLKVLFMEILSLSRQGTSLSKKPHRFERPHGNMESSAGERVRDMLTVPRERGTWASLSILVPLSSS